MSGPPHLPPPDPPAWFWDTIEQAHGNLERFHAALDRLDRDQLQQAYAYFKDLARVFDAPEYVRYMEPGTSEDGAFDVGAWIVTQGREHFRDVYEHPEKTPSSSTPGTREERMMLGDILTHYRQKYGEWIPEGIAPEYPEDQ